MTMLTAATASSFINSLGVNTHIDFNNYGYQNLATVEATLNYLGVKNVRDSAQTSADLSAWQQVAAATGVRFDDYLPEGSPASMQNTLNLVSQLAQEGVLNLIEGGNEEDNAYAASQGNSLGYTAQFQQQVYALGQSLGLPVINMSFGAGWTAANNWHGDYDKVGDLSAYANYGNAHAYPNVGQSTDTALQLIDGDARLAASSRPVIVTELGWDANYFNRALIGQYVVQGALDGIKDGDVKSYYYALFDDGSGAFGLMNADGSPNAAGTALHNLTSLLADNGASLTPGSLSFNLGGALGTDNTLLLQKSDGSDWLAVWDETAGTHAVTLTLPGAVSQIHVFDPVTGTSSIEDASNSSSITLSLGNDPLLVEIVPSGGASSGGSGTTATSGGGVPSTPSGGTGNSASGSTGTGTASASTPDPAVSLPGSASVAPNAAVTLSNVSISDPWAANHAGSMALNVVAAGGTVAMTSNGAAVNGSGSSAIHLSGSLAQINADLATLSYAAGSVGSGSVMVDIWDQAGVEATQSIGINPGGGTGTSGSGSTTGGTTSTPGGNNTTQTIDFGAGTAMPVENASNVTINISGGEQMIFIGGTGDVLNAGGGWDTIQAYSGGNTLDASGGNNTIRYSGSNNTINAGSGNNTLMDSGSNNTIVLPGANQGNDTIYGNLMTNGDLFDMRSMLGGTNWNGSAATLGDFVHVAQSGTDIIVSVSPSGSGGGGYDVATLKGTGPVSLGTLLAHSIT